MPALGTMLLSVLLASSVCAFQGDPALDDDVCGDLRWEAWCSTDFPLEAATGAISTLRENIANEILDAMVGPVFVSAAGDGAVLWRREIFHMEPYAAVPVFQWNPSRRIHEFWDELGFDDSRAFSFAALEDRTGDGLSEIVRLRPGAVPEAEAELSLRTGPWETDIVWSAPVGGVADRAQAEARVELAGPAILRSGDATWILVAAFGPEGAGGVAYLFDALDGALVDEWAVQLERSPGRLSREAHIELHAVALPSREDSPSAVTAHAPIAVVIGRLGRDAYFGHLVAGASRASFAPVLFEHDEEIPLAGQCVAVVGDLDHDGARDFAVGAPGGWEPAERLELEEGAPFSASQVGAVALISSLSGARLAQLRGDVAGEKFGAAISRFADVDGDGVEEILVGSPGEYAVAPRPHVRLVSLRTGKVLGAWPQENGYSTRSGVLFPWISRLGYALAAIPDTNGDGLEEVIVTLARGEALGGGASVSPCPASAALLVSGRAFVR